MLKADRDQHEVSLEHELAARDRRQIVRGSAGHLAGVHMADVTILAAEAGHLGAPAALAAFLQGVRALRAFGRKGPRMPRIVASQQLLVDIEDARAECALAMSIREAVHPRVATADDDHPLAGGADLLAGRRGSGRAPLLCGDPSVALI